MPTRTAARPSTRPGDPTRGRASGLIAAAGLFAVAELGLAVTIGGFFAFGRAEALIFLAFRPWLLLLLACALARRDWRMRAAGYALALSFAALGETLFLHILGSADRLWNDALAGLLAGGLLALLLDLLVQLGRRAGGRLGPVVGFAAGAALLLIPGGLFLYDRILLEPAPAPAEDRPELMLMTALPIIWGESGAFDPTSSPARHQRSADNPLVVAAWLDGLAGIERPRIDGEVEWFDADAPRGRALAFGRAPAGLALLVAVGLGRRRRR